ncbi:MAG TPA: DUF983 domain-containing protein [Magnetospirillum sp.]|nr:DUF983 domain-containing protein [Magnetospirillum sp.]
MPLSPRTRCILTAIGRGLRRRCPHCGVGRCLRGYLTVVDACGHCGEKLGHIRADDGPAYFTVLLVGHLVVPGALVVEQHWAPPLVPFVAGALLVTAALIWALLPVCKGGTVGLMWALKLSGGEMHGDTPPPR